jgi:hypothetical protein
MTTKAVDLAALVPEKHWECPNCTLQDVTREARPHTRMHACAGLRGLTAPMVEAGTKCKVEAHEREDYLGDDDGWVRRDGENRPIMAVSTTRDEGEDRAVFAPTAHGSLAELIGYAHDTGQREHVPTLEAMRRP